MQSLQAGWCPYTMPAHLINQMTASHVTLAPSSELSGHVHPTLGHNRETSLHHGFGSYDFTADNKSSPGRLKFNTNFLMMNRQITTVPEVMYTVQPSCEAHIPYSQYESSSFNYDQPIQPFLEPPVPTSHSHESRLYKHKVVELRDQALPFTTEWCCMVQTQSNNEKTSTQNVIIEPNVLQKISATSKRKKSIDGSKAKTHKNVKFVREGCSKACQRRCKQKISRETRNELFGDFWSLESDAEKKAFIAHHAIKLPMMTCKEGSKRNASVDWAFNVKEESFSVCKRFFLDTLDVPEVLAYAAVKESNHTYKGLPVKAKPQRRKLTCFNPSWIETDIDEYCLKEAKLNVGKRYRYERKERIAHMKPGCVRSCRRCCQSKFSHEQRLMIFNGYRSLNNVRKQREFLRTHVKRLERKEIKKKNGSRRGCSIIWLLDIENESIPVCKTFFLHTVGISEHTAYSIGLQNEVLPVEKTKPVKKHKEPSWISMKSKCMKAMLAKGRTCALLTKFGKITSQMSGKLEEKIGSDKAKNFMCTSLRLTKDSTSVLSPCVKENTEITYQHTSTVFINPSPDNTSEAFCEKIHRPDLDQCVDSGYHCPTSQTSIGTVLNFNVCKLQSQTSIASRHQIETGCLRHLPYSLPGNPNMISNMLSNADSILPSCNDQNTSIIRAKDKLPLKTLQDTMDDIFPTSQKELLESNLKESHVNFNRPKRVTEQNSSEKATGRQLKSGCSDSCRRKCNHKITHSHREVLFREFWQLENDTLRREFILPIVNKVPKKSGKRSDSRRNCTLKWTIPYNGELIVVCKKFFLDTFDVRDNFVHTILEKIERNEGSMEDMRGKHGKKQNAFVQEVSKIENYVKSKATYIAVRCCICQIDFPRWCLDLKMPIGQFYKEYAVDRIAEGGKPACRTSFTSVCVKKLNIKHSSVQENKCAKCEKKIT